MKQFLISRSMKFIFIVVGSTLALACVACGSTSLAGPVIVGDAPMPSASPTDAASPTSIASPTPTASPTVAATPTFVINPTAPVPPAYSSHPVPVTITWNLDAPAIAQEQQVSGTQTISILNGNAYNVTIYADTPSAPRSLQSHEELVWDCAQNATGTNGEHQTSADLDGTPNLMTQASPVSTQIQVGIPLDLRPSWIPNISVCSAGDQVVNGSTRLVFTAIAQNFANQTTTNTLTVNLT